MLFPLSEGDVFFLVSLLGYSFPSRFRIQKALSGLKTESVQTLGDIEADNSIKNLLLIIITKRIAYKSRIFRAPYAKKSILPF